MYLFIGCCHPTFKKMEKNLVEKWRPKTHQNGWWPSPIPALTFLSMGVLKFRSKCTYGGVTSKNRENPNPYHPCMVYLPTFGWLGKDYMKKNYPGGGRHAFWGQMECGLWPVWGWMMTLLQPLWSAPWFATTFLKRRLSAVHLSLARGWSRHCQSSSSEPWRYGPGQHSWQRHNKTGKSWRVPWLVCSRRGCLRQEST